MSALVAWVVIASSALSPEVDTPREKPANLRWNPALDIPVTATLGVGFLLSESVFKKSLAPASCRWCQHNAVDDWFTGIRAERHLQRSVDLASYITVALVPIAALSYGFFQAADWKMFGVDTLVLFEAMVIAASFNQVIKFAAGRERPFVSRLPEAQKPLLSQAEDSNLSFFSGHTTMAFSIAVAAGTLATLRRYPYRAWVWAVGLSLATTTAVLRMVADKHYFTDVLVGAVVGGAAGYAVPALLHGVDENDDATKARVVPTPGGLAVVGHF